MSSRLDYYDDLLKDCKDAIENAQVPADQEGVVIAALILSDSINGLRKALLQASHAPRVYQN